MRRIPLSYRAHVIGLQPLPTGMVEHESALERDFVSLTSFLDPMATVTSQPVTIRFLHDRGSRRYTPDFLVRWSNGRGELIEVKYRKDLRLAWSRLRPAFVAARAWAKDREMGFRLATERSIRGPRLDAAKQLLPLRTAPLDEALAEHAIAAVLSLDGTTFAAVIAALPTGHATALAVVWRLIARGRLRADLSAPIGPNTILRVP